MDTIELGKTGLRVSRLAFGTGTNGWGGRSDQTALGLDGLADLLCLAYEHGVNFWDAADAYGSHPHVARALRGIPRDKVVVSTKTTSRTAQQVTQDVERFLRELDTDVLDVVLMHYVTQADWPRQYHGAMEALSRAKEQGKVRAVGVSCHGLGAVRAAAETDWVDVALVRINHTGASMSARPSEVVPVIEKMYGSGKAVYGMKVLGCGRLVKDARAAMRYVLGLGTVHAMTIGITKRRHLLENVKLIEGLAPQFPLQALR